MRNRTNHQWKNQLIFPLVVVSCFINGWLTKQPFLFLISGYYIFILFCKKQVALLLLAVFCSFFVWLRMIENQPQTVPMNELVQINLTIFPDTIQVNGDIITFEAKAKEGKVRARYQLNSFEEQKSWQKRGNWNKTINVTGTFEEVGKQRNKHSFDPESYAFADNQLGKLIIVDILNSKPSNSFYLRTIRGKMIDWIEEKIPSKLSIYMTALLLGYRDSSFEEIREIYSGTGILHFFTISGMHVYLFYGWFFKFLRRTKLVFSEFSMIGVVILFAGIVIFGQSVSVWRATLLYLLRLIFKEKQIHLSKMDRFSIVLFCLLMIQPKTLLQVSGILSLIISWFILIQPITDINHRFKQSHRIMIFSAPLIMYYFYEFPLLGGLLTALMAPVFAGFLMLILGLCGLVLFQLPYLWLADLLVFLLEHFEKLLEMTKKLVIHTGSPPLILMSMTILGSVLLFEKKSKWYAFPLFLLILFQKFPMQTVVAFVDVGQGDSIVLQSKWNQEVYVIDTGGRLLFEREAWQERNYRPPVEYSLLPYLKGQGIDSIDGLFLTHGDADHMGDALRLIEKISVKNVYVGKGSLQHQSIQNLKKNLPKTTNLREVNVNEVIGKHPSIEVLAPNYIGKGENEDSLVLKTTIGKLSFLFTGDLGKEGERQLLKSYPDLQIDVMKLGHHGSKTSTDQEFIERIQLKHGIISAGKNNRFGHPHSEVLQTLAETNVKLFRTDESGMIRYVWQRSHTFPAVQVMIED